MPSSHGWESEISSRTIGALKDDIEILKYNNKALSEILDTHLYIEEKHQKTICELEAIVGFSNGDKYQIAYDRGRHGLFESEELNELV